MRRLFSLEGKLTALTVALVVLAVLFSFVLAEYTTLWVGLPLALLIVVSGTLVATRAFVRPISRLLSALIDSTQNFKDKDFSIRIASDRRDELGELVDSHNEVGDLIRDERYALHQRELLLETVFESTPVAIVLTDEQGRIVFSNTEARHFLGRGRKLEGFALDEVLSRAPGELARAISDGVNGLISIERDGEVETLHVLNRRFTLNSRVHWLVQVREMTRELRRQEVTTWKKVIRVISHELNNSLAPISSLAHSGKLALDKEDEDTLARILGTIGDRASHLKSFIEGYARFARLPQPNLERTDVAALIRTIAGQYPVALTLEGLDRPVAIDAAQFEQVLINLIGNARDADPGGDIEVAARLDPSHLFVAVRDRGPGMSKDVLQNALLPFYSTKQEGTGLGLALAREIVEAHNGSIRIVNRPEGGIEVSFVIPG